MAMPAEAAPPDGFTGKHGEPINIFEFVLSQHSLLGLCFSRAGPAPVTIGCGCVPIGDLPIRQRLFSTRPPTVGSSRVLF